MITKCSNNIINYEKPAFDAILAAEIRHHAVNTSGARITYSINGAGNNRGSGMVDTRQTQLHDRRE